MTDPTPDYTVPGWRTAMNLVFYRLAYVPDLGEDSAARMARWIIEDRTYFHGGVHDLHWALVRAVAAEHLFWRWSITHDLDEEAVRAFCVRVLHHLDAARPWPVRPAIVLDADAWPWDQAPVFRHIGVAIRDLAEFGHRSGVVRLVDGTPSWVQVMRLHTGQVLALIDSIGTRDEPPTSTQLRVLEGDPEAALASFLQISGCPPEQVRRE